MRRWNEALASYQEAVALDPENVRNLSGVGAFSGPGTFLWTGGDLAGTLTINAGTTVSVSGDTEKRLYAGTINNFGTIVWTWKSEYSVSYTVALTATRWSSHSLRRPAS